MGEDTIVGFATKERNYNRVPHGCDSVVRRDCDGDYNTYCFYGGYCAYKRTVIDCDGDIVTLCDK